MKTIMVTGVTGGLGKDIVHSLIKNTAVANIKGLARDPEKAAELTAMGVEVRHGDYFHKNSLVKSFAGVHTLFLVSTIAFTDRVTQHKNVIDAAKEANVKHIFYTSIFRKGKTPTTISQVTESDIQTESMIKNSGIAYTIVQNPMYLDAMSVWIGNTDNGIQMPAGNGKIAMATRLDLAKASAQLLLQNGHENKTYFLNNGRSYSFTEIAETLSKVLGKEIKYTNISREESVAKRIAEGTPDFVANFLEDWIVAAKNGEFDEPNNILRELIGEVSNLEDGLRISFNKK